jgi:hypothetical protein
MNRWLIILTMFLSLEAVAQSDTNWSPKIGLPITVDLHRILVNYEKHSHHDLNPGTFDSTWTSTDPVSYEFRIHRTSRDTLLFSVGNTSILLFRWRDRTWYLTDYEVEIRWVIDTANGATLTKIQHRSWIPFEANTRVSYDGTFRISISSPGIQSNELPTILNGAELGERIVSAFAANYSGSGAANQYHESHSSSFSVDSTSYFRFFTGSLNSSVDELQPDRLVGVSFFPNPAVDEIRVQASNIVRVQVYDLLGRAVDVSSFEEESSTRRIDLTGLHPGIYRIHVFTSLGELTSSFVVCER